MTYILSCGSMLLFKACDSCYTDAAVFINYPYVGHSLDTGK